MVAVVSTTTTRSTTPPHAGTSTATDRDAPGLAQALLAPFRDAWNATRARLAVLIALGRDGGDVAVEAYRGNVVLHGDVADRDASAAAERAVHALGVGVSNRLRVRGAHAPNVGISDAEIRTAVNALLRDARALRGSIVTIENVYDGVVLLRGVARDARAVADAFELVIHTPGVRRVINDVVPQRQPAAEDDADAA